MSLDSKKIARNMRRASKIGKTLAKHKGQPYYDALVDFVANQKIMQEEGDYDLYIQHDKDCAILKLQNGDLINGSKYCTCKTPEFALGESDWLGYNLKRAEVLSGD